MATVHFVQETIATPDQFIAGLTDFGPVLPPTADAAGRTYPPISGCATLD
jgi:hypothetical protein